MGSGNKIKTDPTEPHRVLRGWTRLTLAHHKTLSSWRKRTCFHFHVYTCVTEKVQTSTSYPEAFRPHSVSEARIFFSFQLLSIVLTYKVNSLFYFSQPVLAQSSSENRERKRKRERQEVLWPDTHPKIATVNIHTKKTGCTVRVSQGWPNFFTRFLSFLISQLTHGGRMCRILGAKCRLNLVRARTQTFSLGSPLKTKGFPPKAMFKFATNISRILRIVCNTGVAVTAACSRASAEENAMLHVHWLLTNRKALTSLWTFLTIIPNIRDTKPLTWHKCSTNSVFVIQIYQGATVDYI